MSEDAFDYVCRICGWQYQTLSGLRGHIPTHTLTSELYGALVDRDILAARAAELTAQVAGLRETLITAGSGLAATYLVLSRSGDHDGAKVCRRMIDQIDAALAPATAPTSEEGAEG